MQIVRREPLRERSRAQPFPYSHLANQRVRNSSRTLFMTATKRCGERWTNRGSRAEERRERGTNRTDLQHRQQRERVGNNQGWRSTSRGEGSGRQTGQATSIYDAQRRYP